LAYFAARTSRHFALLPLGWIWTGTPGTGVGAGVEVVVVVVGNGPGGAAASATAEITTGKRSVVNNMILGNR